jgi:hypothetical protein
MGTYCYSLALSSPGWTPLCLYHLRLDHPDLRKSGTAHEGLRHPRGQASSGEPPDIAHTPGPNRNFLLTPGALSPRPFPRILASLGPGPSASCSWSSAPGFLGLWKSISCPRRTSSPQAFAPFRAASLWCFSPMVSLSGIATSALALLFWTPLGLYRIRIDHEAFGGSRLHSRCFATHLARSLSGTKPPSGHPQVMPPTPTPNQDYLTTGTSPPSSSPGCLLR